MFTCRSPLPRWQFIDTVDGVAVANPVEHIGQPDLRVHIVELGRLQQASLPATARSGPHPKLESRQHTRINAFSNGLSGAQPAPHANLECNYGRSS